MNPEENAEHIIKDGVGGKKVAFALYALKMLKPLIISMRPSQWYKNILVFATIIFAGKLDNVSMWVLVILAFIYFCGLSAADYLINDVIDREKDRSHPTKCQRPIALGNLGTQHAVLVAVILIVLCFAGAYLTINIRFFVACVSYIVLGILYSFVLRKQALIDVLSISVGFIIRVTAGATAISFLPSTWLVICVFLLALFLALGKRRQDVIILGEEVRKHRASFSGYSLDLLNQQIGIIGGVTIIAYIMYSFYSPYKYILFTLPFVIYGIFRYLHLTYENGGATEPHEVFADRAMLINLGLWVLAVISIIIFDTKF